MALATETAENHPTELSGAATQPMSAGRTTTDHVPTAASAPARRAAGIAVEGLVDEVADVVVDVVVVLDGASGLTPALRVAGVAPMVTRSPPRSERPRRWDLRAYAVRPGAAAGVAGARWGAALGDGPGDTAYALGGHSEADGHPEVTVRSELLVAQTTSRGPA